MAKLRGTPRGDSSASIAKSQATSSSESILMDNQDSDNDSNEASSSAISDNQDSQNEDNSEIASIGTPLDSPCSIIEDQLSERLSSLPAKYLDRYIELQDSSPFWENLISQPSPNNSDTDATGPDCCPPLKSREWAEFVVDASRIFFEARLSVSEVVGIINYTIRWVTICLLNIGEKTIYFEDRRNVFYEPQSGGMTEFQETKYEDFLSKMRATILEGKEEAQSDSEMEVIPESGDESSSDAGEVSQLEDAVTPVEGAVTITSQEETTDTLPLELSTIAMEAQASTLNTKENSVSQNQTAKSSPQTKKKRNRARKERRKRARLRAKLLSESRDTKKSKADKRRRWRQNRKRKETLKKANAAARQAAGV